MAVKKQRSKKKSGATRNTKQNSSGLSWLLMALVVGLFVAFLVYLDKFPNQEGGKNTASHQGEKQPSSKQQQGRQANEQKVKPPKHQFDFYTVLPDREVEIIDVEEEQVPQKTVTPKEAIKASSTQSMVLYQLQVGAFKELSKADAMKARLAFLGVESNIQVIHNKGQKMYRVRVGPSTDSQKINRIKEQLKAQNITTFVQKLKG